MKNVPLTKEECDNAKAILYLIKENRNPYVRAYTDEELFIAGYATGKGAALKWTEDDLPLPEDDAINAAHPLESDDHAMYAEAMRLVGAKRSKGALVDLVNWLLHRINSKARMPVPVKVIVKIQKLYSIDFDGDYSGANLQLQLVIIDSEGHAIIEKEHVVDGKLGNDTTKSEYWIEEQLT